MVVKILLVFTLFSLIPRKNFQLKISEHKITKYNKLKRK